MSIELKLRIGILGGILLASSPVSAEVMKLLVPIQTISPNRILEPSDFIWKEFEVAAHIQSNYAADFKALATQTSTKTLPKGRPILLNSLRKKSIIEKGKQTAVQYLDDGIEIFGVLVPQEDGKIGQTILTSNPATKELVWATVQTNGTLLIASGAP